MQKQTDPAFQSILKRWKDFSAVYSSMDSCPQTFFFSLINQLKIQKADNILEIACGAGLLLPFVVDQKKPSAQYVATDLTPAMVEIAEQRLQSNFDKYDSKLTLEQWMKKQKIVLRQANGELPLQEYGKFDRVICNLVLMLTINPKNILTSVHKTTTDDALMGITIWGNKQARKAIKALDLPLSSSRSPFYYQDVIHADLKETGWQIVFQWQQTAPFPLTTPQDIDPYLQTLNQNLKDYKQEDQVNIKAKLKEFYIEQLNKHIIMQMSNKLFIVKKAK